MLFKGMGLDEDTWRVTTEKEGKLLTLKQNLEFGNKKTTEKWASQAAE